MPQPARRSEWYDAWGTSRHSRLFPGPWLVHADLHNHTWLSDGVGDPALAFACMRAAGLDVAAITDHSRWASAFLGLVSAPGWTGIDGRAWRRAGSLADEANLDGEFVAMRGFEWSDAMFGHINVWGSRRFTDPLRTFPTMGRFWRWLEAGGRDGLVGFNHPGTGRLRFAGFRYRPAMAERLVSLEIFNKTDDYLFKGTDRGESSPLSQCLDAGWQVGLLGVTDEHGADWGCPEGKGRAGLYVRDLSRQGVLEALAARRFFASRVKGLRVDAALTSLTSPEGGSPPPRFRMGSPVVHRPGPALVQVDLDRGEGWWGRRLNVQVLRPAPGHRLPGVDAAVEVRLPGPDEPVIAFEIDLDPADGDWVVLRVSDPSGPADPRATGEYARLGRGIAYTSPFWLVPAQPTKA
ncbi:MAG TPA: CehA/McbA family metallohydrolase [Actinomycetes bacterium]|jgi:hypothetical protein|nr:CehA/McbA family metallohydrolase [Actinomycetes bacterium]